MSAVVAVAALLVPLTPHSRSSSSSASSSSSCVLSRYSSSFSLASSSSSSSSSYCVLLRSLPRVSRICWHFPVTNSQQQFATSQDGHTVVVDEGGGGGRGGDEEAYSVSRRRVLSRLGFGLATALVALGLSSEQQQEEAFAVPLTQLAGRIPGLSAPDVNGKGKEFCYPYAVGSKVSNI